MISVIIPCYNAEKFVLDSISSILNQSFSDLEVLVIDDCSTDNTLNILKSISDPRLEVHTNSENLGYLKTINKLLTLANGDFIAFQDADDLSHINRLRLQIDYMLSNPSISILGTNFSVINSQGQEIRRSHVEENNLLIKQILLERNPFQKPSIMFRRQVYDVIGGYREEFLSFKNISEDYDWLLRASKHFNFGNINGNEPLYHYRMVSTAMTKDFNDIEQLFGHKIALFLHEQRLSGEKDSIERGNLDEVMYYIDCLKKPYLDDPSLFYHVKISYLLYGKLNKEAAKCGLDLLKSRPSLRNLKLLLYTIKMWIISRH